MCAFVLACARASASASATSIVSVVRSETNVVSMSCSFARGMVQSSLEMEYYNDEINDDYNGDDDDFSALQCEFPRFPRFSRRPTTSPRRTPVR